MRLLTHNFLQSNVKGTENGYPLRIEAEEVVIEESPLDADLLIKVLPKLNYSVLVGAVHDLAVAVVSSSSSAVASNNLCLPELPPTLLTLDNYEDLRKDPSLLANLHTVLMDVHLLEGNLVCPDTGRKFPVKEGIPNMILHEDEI